MQELLGWINFFTLFLYRHENLEFFREFSGISGKFSTKKFWNTSGNYPLLKFLDFSCNFPSFSRIFTKNLWNRTQHNTLFSSDENPLNIISCCFSPLGSSSLMSSTWKWKKRKKSEKFIFSLFHFHTIFHFISIFTSFPYHGISPCQHFKNNFPFLRFPQHRFCVLRMIQQSLWTQSKTYSMLQIFRQHPNPELWIFFPHNILISCFSQKKKKQIFGFDVLKMFKCALFHRKVGNPWLFL